MLAVYVILNIIVDCRSNGIVNPTTLLDPTILQLDTMLPVQVFDNKGKCLLWRSQYRQDHYWCNAIQILIIMYNKFLHYAQSDIIIVTIAI